MNELSGRQIHEDGAIVILPLFYQSGVIIVPGQILPLNLFHPQVNFMFFCLFNV